MFGGLVSARHPIGGPERKVDGLPIWAGIYWLVLAFFVVLVSPCRGSRLRVENRPSKVFPGLARGHHAAHAIRQGENHRPRISLPCLVEGCFTLARQVRANAC